MEIKKVGVVGCGMMGSGIAQICAQAGYEVTVSEIDEELLAKGIASIESFLNKGIARGKVTAEEKEKTLSKIHGTTNMADFKGCDLVIEAASEDIEIKNRIFTELGKICPPHTILATNTSGHTVIKFAKLTGRVDKVVGMHFFNPAQIMKLMELVRTIASSDETIQTAKAFGESIGKVVVIAKDVPGFIVNRLLTPFLISAIRMAEDGLATPEDIDKAVTNGLNHPIGPFQMLDTSGIDLFVKASGAKYEELKDERFLPPLLLKQMADAGWCGKKSGKGFYSYDKQS